MRHFDLEVCATCDESAAFWTLPASNDRRSIAVIGPAPQFASLLPSPEVSD
jgi:hypothetical protein